MTTFRKVCHHQRSEIVCYANQNESFCLCYTLHTCFMCVLGNVFKFLSDSLNETHFSAAKQIFVKINFWNGKVSVLLRVENVNKDVIVITATVFEVSPSCVAYSLSCFQECRVGFFFRVIKFHHHISIFLT